MTKKITFAFLFSFICLAGFSQGISFQEDSWDKVVAKAKAQDKLIFMDAYTSWCGPCKLLQARVFPDAELGKYFNGNFISAKYDMEKGEGPTLAAKFAVRAYPTLYFIDPNTQEIVQKVIGYRNPEQLLAVAKTAAEKKTKNSAF